MRLNVQAVTVCMAKDVHRCFLRCGVLIPSTAAQG